MEVAHRPVFRRVVVLGALLAAAPAAANDLILLRTDHSKQTAPVNLEVRAAGQANDFVGPPREVVLRVGYAAGASPLRFVFTADWNGDGERELVLVRERVAKGHRLDLKVVRPPLSNHGKYGKVLASSWKDDLGFASGDGRVVALGAADVDDDGRDDLLIVRAFDAGHHALEVRRLPRGKHKEMGAPIASDPAFGPTGPTSVVAICGLEFAPNWGGIALLTRDPLLPDALAVYSLPARLDGDVGLPLSADPNLIPPASGSYEGLSCFDYDGDGMDELLLRAELDDGTDRLDVYSASFSGDVGFPVAFDATLGVPGHDYPVLAALDGGPSPSGNHGYPANAYMLTVNSSWGGGGSDKITTTTWPDVMEVSIDPKPSGGFEIVFPNAARVPLTMPAPPATGAVSIQPMTVECPYPNLVAPQESLSITFPSVGQTMYYSDGIFVLQAPYPNWFDPPSLVPLGVVTPTVGAPFVFNWICLTKI